jgi:structural maintenance of chromosome 2
MLFVFGGTFICEDAATAKKVTFHDAIRTRSVTLDGDVYDPSGSLSGGSAPSGNRTLIEVQALLEVESNLRNARRELDAAEREEAQAQRVREEWKKLSRDLEIKEHELKLLEEQVGGSNASRVSAFQAMESE